MSDRPPYRSSWPKEETGTCRGTLALPTPGWTTSHLLGLFLLLFYFSTRSAAIVHVCAGTPVSLVPPVLHSPAPPST